MKNKNRRFSGDKEEPFQAPNSSLSSSLDSELENRLILKAILDSSSLPFACLDCNFNFIKISRAYAEMAGQTPPYFLGKNLFSLYQFNEEEQNLLREAVIEGKSVLISERPLIMADDQKEEAFCLDFSFIPIKDDKGKVSGLILNLSRKLEPPKEKEFSYLYNQKLRKLASKLPMLEDEERKKIATEINQKINKELAMIKTKLLLLNKIHYVPNFSEQIEEIIGTLETVIAVSSSLAFELNSPILYESDFPSAINWLVEQLKERSELPLEFKVSPSIELPDEEVRILLFHALRKLLMCIIEHLKPEAIYIKMYNFRCNLLIEIDGITDRFASGDMVESLECKERYELAKVEEIISYFSGKLELNIKPEKFVKFTITSPLKLI